MSKRMLFRFTNFLFNQNKDININTITEGIQLKYIKKDNKNFSFISV